jgi:peptide deformylase
MTVLPLIIAPDPLLLIPSKKVEVIDDSIRTLLADMLETMYANDGIGLAAVQVGVHQKLIVVDIGIRDGKPTPIKLVNPEIIENSEEHSSYNEGCLSFPDQFSEVERPAEVTVRYQDEQGKTHTLHAHDILATCLQHEIDHTNGIVFVDHISSLKRDIILRRLKKAKRLGLVSALPEEQDAAH